LKEKAQETPKAIQAMKPAAIPASERRLAFAAEWYHAEAGIIRPFLITYYVSDKAVEVVRTGCSSLPFFVTKNRLSVRSVPTPLTEKQQIATAAA